MNAQHVIHVVGAGQVFDLTGDVAKGQVRDLTYLGASLLRVLFIRVD